MIKKITIVLLSVATLFGSSFAGASKPVELGVISPSVQIQDVNDDISGVRLGLLYLKNRNVTGLDLEFIAGKTTGDFLGAQFGLVNLVDGNFTGFQDGAVNINGKLTEGVQFGLFNKAEKMSGLQLGLVNMAQYLNGLQIGLVNFAENSQIYKVFPIFNFSFN